MYLFLVKKLKRTSSEQYVRMVSSQEVICVGVLAREYCVCVCVSSA